MSGLVLVVFVLTHLLNHALGLVSLEAMETARRYFLALWRNPLGTVILYLSLGLHLGLALWSLYERRSFRIRVVDWLQLALGFSIPIVLVLHILGTRIAHEVYGVEDNYLYELLILFFYLPEIGVKQIILVLIVWLHAMVGLHQWLRLKPFYPRYQPLALGLALLVPTLSLAGTGVAARDVRRLAADEAWLRGVESQLRFLDGEEVQRIYQAETWILIVFAILTLGFILARPVSRWLRHRRSLVRIEYPGGRKALVPQGNSVLEASRLANIPHASVCGGRGRCSTCRVRIVRGHENLPAPDAEELRVINRIGGGEHLRLACQLRPSGDCAVVPLVVPEAAIEALGGDVGYKRGQEREVVVLFADLRGFTALSEDRLPYDVVFILNRYFAAMGQAIEAAGGHVDKFIGDGVMALFGLEQGSEEACRSALAAARAMAEALGDLNKHLELELGSPLRIGIGLHFGPAIVGEMGHGSARHLTAVGDTVNTASRLESMTKEFGVQLVASADVVSAAGLAIETECRDVTLRGRQEKLSVHLVADALLLSAGTRT